MFVIPPIDVAFLQVIEDGLGMAGCEEDRFRVLILPAAEPVAFESSAQALKTVRPGGAGMGTEPAVANPELARQHIIDRYLLGPVIAHNLARVGPPLLIA